MLMRLFLLMTLTTTAFSKPPNGGGTLPVPSDDALEKWGSVTIDVVNCGSMTITTDMQEGLKDSNTIRIVSVAGLACVD